jgi:hypothetical protein
MLFSSRTRAFRSAPIPRLSEGVLCQTRFDVDEDVRHFLLVESRVVARLRFLWCQTACIHDLDRVLGDDPLRERARDVLLREPSQRALGREARLNRAVEPQAEAVNLGLPGRPDDERRRRDVELPAGEEGREVLVGDVDRDGRAGRAVEQAVEGGREVLAQAEQPCERLVREDVQDRPPVWSPIDAAAFVVATSSSDALLLELSSPRS